MGSVRPSTARDVRMVTPFPSPMGPGRPSTPATVGYGVHSNQIPMSSQANWISSSTRPPSVNRMASQVNETNRISNHPISRTDEMSSAVFTGEANATFQGVDGGIRDWNGRLTEEIMLSLITDDSFMAEVVPSLITVAVRSFMIFVSLC